MFEHVTRVRVRYSETDQMGTFYNARALEWFEVGRTELLRAAGMAYAEVEKRGVMLPLVEAHVEYRGRARYDDELEIRSAARMEGKVRMRFEVEIVKLEEGKEPAPVVRGWTVHALLGAEGKVVRGPEWLRAALREGVEHG